MAFWYLMWTQLALKQNNSSFTEQNTIVYFDYIKWNRKGSGNNYINHCTHWIKHKNRNIISTGVLNFEVMVRPKYWSQCLHLSALSAQIEQNTLCGVNKPVSVHWSTKIQGKFNKLVYIEGWNKKKVLIFLSILMYKGGRR